MIKRKCISLYVGKIGELLTIIIIGECEKKKLNGLEIYQGLSMKDITSLYRVRETEIVNVIEKIETIENENKLYK